MKDDKEKVIPVIRSSMPSFEEYAEMIRPMWESRWLSNMGERHEKLTEELTKYLKVSDLVLFVNGHMALELCLQAMQLKGEVITTPFTFASTTHAIVRNGLTPVFCDIKEDDYTMDPDKIEALITPETSAIVPVHVYGTPCDVGAIEGIAKKHGLKVIYDAAHAFGVEVNGESILNEGDLSTLSFHATKVFNTIEGGAIVMHDAETKKQIDYLKNFGFAGETEVVGPGINSKMDEIRSAYGLLNLKHVDTAIEARHQVAVRYRNALKDIGGISFFKDLSGIRHNYSYFPIFVDADKYGMTRDELYFKMKEKGVLGRRYFYPLISSFSTYRGLPSSVRSNLPNAHKMADRVICLPMHHTITEAEIFRIIDIIVEK